ncbi:MAG: thioredoxin family protein, partial [Pyrinomonadaceae bacterium]|nr:thioredoxin family protein [Pyrinomonadaceae bacterium]
MSNVDLRKYVETAMTYGEYVALMDELLAKGMATGADQSEDHVNYTKLNRQRMSRIDKTVSVNNVTSDAVSAVERDQVWLILTEGWCGDGAQNLPVVEK